MSQHHTLECTPTVTCNLIFQVVAHSAERRRAMPEAVGAKPAYLTTRMERSVTGNTPDFGPGDSRFEPLRSSQFGNPTFMGMFVQQQDT